MLKFSLKKVAIAASLLLLAGLFFITGCLTIVSGAEAPQSQKFAFTNLENEKDTAIFIDGQAKKNSEEGTMNLFKDKDSSDYIYIIEGLTNTNSEIMISMPKAVKASECDWIEIYLLLGNWGVTGSTYTKVTAYAAADTEHELQAGTMQCDAESNKVGILRIDPYKVADKDGNVQTIRLQIYSDTEQTAGQINLFLNYLRVLPADTGAVKSVTLQTGKYIAPKNPANLNDENVTWLALNCSEEAYENYGKENHAYQHYDTRSFPKAEVYDATINEGATCIRAKNGVFALDLGRVKASDYGQMSMDFNIMTRLDVCKAKVRIAERTFTTFGSRGGVVFVINGAWQLGDKLLTTDQGACWFDGRHTLRLLQPQGKLLFSEINWLAGHSPDQVQ